MKTGSWGDITRIPCLELFSILNVLFPHKTIKGNSRITYVLDFTDSKKVFWLNPMIYDLGMLCFMPSTFLNVCVKCDNILKTETYNKATKHFVFFFS